MGPAETQLAELGVTDVLLLRRAAAVDAAARGLIAEAAETTGQDLAGSAASGPARRPRRGGPVRPPGPGPAPLAPGTRPRLAPAGTAEPG